MEWISNFEDDVKIKQILEAADTFLVNSSMYQEKQTDVSKSHSKVISRATKSGLPKSQRYLIEDTESLGLDFSLPKSMQKHLAKEFNEILEKHYEFYDSTEKNLTKFKNKYKSRVKLFKGDDCYVSPYEDLVDDIKGPSTKPVIKRRIVDDQIGHNCDEDALKLISIDGNLILLGQEVEAWAKKKERKDKIFHYKMASNGVLHAKEQINEFTINRNKNKWNESKIKDFKKFNKIGK